MKEKNGPQNNMSWKEANGKQQDGRKLMENNKTWKN